MAWEYMEIRYINYGSDEQGIDDNKFIIFYPNGSTEEISFSRRNFENNKALELLNKFGSLNWELVSITSEERKEKYYGSFYMESYILKRLDEG